jgi:hypothetical protein
MAAAVQTFTSITSAAASTALDNGATVTASYHRLVIIATGFSGSGAITVAIEVSFDSTTYTVLPSGGQLTVTGNGVFEAPFPGPAPCPARFTRGNVVSWPAGVSATLNG